MSALQAFWIMVSLEPGATRSASLRTWPFCISRRWLSLNRDA